MGIVITGGAGFVGSALVDELLQRNPGAEITVLDALVYPMGEKNLSDKARKHPGLKFVKGSVGDAGLLDSILQPGDQVVHLAVEMAKPHLFIETQISGTKTILDASLRRQVKHFVYQSTGDIYGHNESDDIDENAPSKPTHLYAATKLGAEALVSAYHHTYGLPTTILRPVSIYGRRQYPGWLVARFCTLAIAGKPLTVMGSGSARRDWIYVTDIAKALAAALENKPEGEVYNIGTGREWSVMQIAEMVLDLAGVPHDRIERLPERDGDFARQITHARKAKSKLGWSAQVPFEQGLRYTFDWYASNQAWVSTQMAGEGASLGFRVKED